MATYKRNKPKYEDDLKLIDLYRENRILWDSRREDYKLTEKKHEIWRRIASELQLDPETGHEVCKHRMKSIRNAYLNWKKEARKRKQQPVGSSGPSRAIVPYKYAAELAFLEPAATLSQTVDSMCHELDTYSDDNDNGSECETKDSQRAVSDDDMETASAASMPLASTSANLQSYQQKSKKSKVSPPTSADNVHDVIGKVTDTINVVNNLLAKKASESEGHTAFANLLYHLMKDLPQPALDLCRIRIQQVIMEYTHGATQAGQQTGIGPYRQAGFAPQATLIGPLPMYFMGTQQMLQNAVTTASSQSCVQMSNNLNCGRPV